MNALSFVPSLAAVSFVATFLLVAPVQARQILQPDTSHSTPKELLRLQHLANEAHMQGDVSEEIEYRRRYSEKAWAAQPHDGSVDKYLLIFLNDLPLAILLEGNHEWPEAEALFRHNQSELAHERLAGNDIKSENDLHLAHLLEREGKGEEARSICSYWEGRVRHIADGALSAVKYDVPPPPLDDSPEVEIGGWKLACGKPREGEHLLREQMAAHPDMLAPYTFLSLYYFSEGEFKKGLEIETDGMWVLMKQTTATDAQVAGSKAELH